MIFCVQTISNIITHTWWDGMISLGRNSFDFIIEWEEWGTLPTYLSTKSNCWVFFNIITALSWFTSRKDWLFNINISSPTYFSTTKYLSHKLLRNNFNTCYITNYLGLCHVIPLFHVWTQQKFGPLQLWIFQVHTQFLLWSSIPGYLQVLD